MTGFAFALVFLLGYGLIRVVIATTRVITRVCTIFHRKNYNHVIYDQPLDGLGNDFLIFLAGIPCILILSGNIYLWALLSIGFYVLCGFVSKLYFGNEKGWEVEETRKEK